MGHLSDYFSRTTGVETKDTTPRTKVEDDEFTKKFDKKIDERLKEITHVKSEDSDEFIDKLKGTIEEIKSKPVVVEPVKPATCELHIPNLCGFIGTTECDDQLNAMKVLLTVEEYEILQDTTRFSPKERILKYVSAIQKLIDRGIFDDDNEKE